MEKTARKHLVGPFGDLLLLGALSLVLIPFSFIDIPAASVHAVLLFSYLAADLVNHPHFAASYILFYRNFSERVRNVTYHKLFRLRNVFAGVVVPLLLLGYFAFAIGSNNLPLLGYAANAMAFLVGWHYVKQGYGMLIIDSIFKKQFYQTWEKHIFLANGFIFWLLTWVYANRLLAENEMWGVSYFSIQLPAIVLPTLAVMTALSGTLLMFVLTRRIILQPKETAWTGVISYLISVYIWLMGLHSPVMLLLIPMFHSLQYLTVVYRFEQNRINKQIPDKQQRRNALLRFGALAIVLGFAGFWFVPSLLDGVNLKTAILSVTEPLVYAFSFWIFINVHHYFIDNVLWKSQNTEIKEHLF
jgi:hypothetical protein